MRRFFLRLATFFRRDRVEEDLAREVASHLALLEDEHLRRGMSPDEARLAARRAIGGVERAKDLHRDARSFLWLDDARRDLQYAARMLRRSPGFAAVAIVTMALGIGATTLFFSLAYGVLLRPLPWPDADRVVRLQETRAGKPGVIPLTVTNGTYLAWRNAPSTVEEIGGWLRSQSMTITGEGEAERLRIGRVTPSLMRVLRARPALGRTFEDAEALPGQPNVALLGFGLWQRRFGGRPDIVGRSIRLDGKPFTIVGVMPRDFVFLDRDVQAWTPMYVFPVKAEGTTLRLMIFPAVARLRSGVSAAQAATEATLRARAAPDPAEAGLALFGNTGEAAISAASLREVATAEVRPAIGMLIAAVGLLFVTATASLAVLQLSRIASRRREIAVRTAIGAGAGRLARQWLVESGALGLAGGAAGILVAALLHRALPFVLPADFPRVEDVRFDMPAALFASAVTLIASAVCGMVPALQGRGGNLVERLSEDGTATEGQMRTPAARMRTAVMAGQVAIACVLLIGAGLLARSFVALLGADRGYDPRGLLTATLPMPPQSTFAARTAFLDALHARLGAVPGVTHVAFGNALPFVTAGTFRGMTIPLPRDPSVKTEVQATVRAVSPEYFGAMRLRIAQGRPITNADNSSSQPVVIVNKSFAAKYLVGQPVGQHLPLGIDGRSDWEVVGVVDDMRQGNISGSSALWTSVGKFGGVLDPPQPELFFSHRQWPWPISDLILVVRSSLEPTSLVPILRAAVRDLDPSLALDSVMTMDDRVRESLAAPRTYAVFLGAFAIIAVVVAGVGLFGVLSYTTAQRTREIGVRTALGAARRDILGLVVREAAAMTMSGLCVGLLAAFFLAQSLSKLLYGVSTRDAVSFLVVPVILVVVAIVSCAVPAWRAARIDPLRASRFQ